MRSSVGCGNDDLLATLLFAMHLFGSGFFGAVCSVASVGIDDEGSRLRGGSLLTCRSLGAGRTSRNSVPYRLQESIPGWPTR